MAFFFVLRNWLFCYAFRVRILLSISLSVTLSVLSRNANISLLSVSRSVCIYFFLLFLHIVISHCKLSVFYIYTLQTVRKVLVSYLYSLIPTMAMCYSKTTKREITHFEYCKKNVWNHVLHSHNNKKNIHHIEYWKKSVYNRCGNSITSCQNLIKFFEPSRK